MENVLTFKEKNWHGVLTLSIIDILEYLLGRLSRARPAHSARPWPLRMIPVAFITTLPLPISVCDKWKRFKTLSHVPYGDKISQIENHWYRKVRL